MRTPSIQGFRSPYKLGRFTVDDIAGLDKTLRVIEVTYAPPLESFPRFNQGVDLVEIALQQCSSLIWAQFRRWEELLVFDVPRTRQLPDVEQQISP